VLRRRRRVLKSPRTPLTTKTIDKMKKTYNSPELLVVHLEPVTTIAQSMGMFSDDPVNNPEDILVKEFDLSDITDLGDLTGGIGGSIGGGMDNSLPVVPGME
jgi:hypothetical protein